MAFAGLAAGFLSALASIIYFLFTQDQRFLNGAPIAAIIVSFIFYFTLALSSPILPSDSVDKGHEPRSERQRIVPGSD